MKKQNNIKSDKKDGLMRFMQGAARAGRFFAYRGGLKEAKYQKQRPLQVLIRVGVIAFVLYAVLTAPPEGAGVELALEVKETPADIVAYKRSLYRHWIDADKDCQDTRQEVLIAESMEEVRLDEKGCKVLEGKWLDPYTGNIYTDPRKLDIDHWVPLKEAHNSGGHGWDKEKRRHYANDLGYEGGLIAVSARANRSKGAKDPAQWMPVNDAFACEYIATWVAVKSRWDMYVDSKEAKAIAQIKRDKNCGGVKP